MDIFLLFDGKFHVIKGVEQLYSHPLHKSFAKILERIDLSSSRKHQTNETKQVAKSFIVILNDMLKCLAKGAGKLPLFVLDTLETIFGMNCLNFDLETGGVYLFGARNQDNANENWVNRIGEMLNKLIEYKQTITRGITKIPEYWPIAVFLLAFTCGLYFLEKNHTREVHSFLTDDQKNKFETYLGRLHEILDNICQNLEKNKLNSFSDNIEVLQGLLEEFATFLKNLNNSLEKQMEELHDKKEKEEIKTGFYIIASIISIVSMFISWMFGKKIGVFFGGVAAGFGGSFAVHSALNVKRFQKIVEKLQLIQKLGNNSKNLLTNIQDYNFELKSPEFMIILSQFQTFRGTVEDLQQHFQRLDKPFE
ncbi:hypothetical protein RclHR1_01180003 [Rhizophagus clarus]|uniref:Uncharacterized protein n=1 Tax=Rhizophagus clarus TaxID=94130 RepID=A0A2Z6QY68_9GLOM|nr:hypothetical protein RclHR1_01180003 [Rhizophagus clarus]GES79560.1 hypothetical protein GLOIN_2v1780318 [Rhizophagus clarus]